VPEHDPVVVRARELYPVGRVKVGTGDPLVVTVKAWETVEPLQSNKRVPVVGVTVPSWTRVGQLLVPIAAGGTVTLGTFWLKARIAPTAPMTRLDSKMKRTNLRRVGMIGKS
jgi:hypothetical protein